MSKLDDILKFTENIDAYENTSKAKQQIKDLFQELVDETVTGLGGDVPYGELSKMIEEL